MSQPAGAARARRRPPRSRSPGPGRPPRRRPAAPIVAADTGLGAVQVARLEGSAAPASRPAAGSSPARPRSASGVRGAASSSRVAISVSATAARSLQLGFERVEGLDRACVLEARLDIVRRRGTQPRRRPRPGRRGRPAPPRRRSSPRSPRRERPRPQPLADAGTGGPSRRPRPRARGTRRVPCARASSAAVADRRHDPGPEQVVGPLRAADLLDEVEECAASRSSGRPSPAARSPTYGIVLPAIGLRRPPASRPRRPPRRSRA